MKKILFDILVAVVCVITVWYVYVEYGDRIVDFLFGEQPATMYIESLPISVTIADEPGELQIGLSHTESLPELSGKLFVFSCRRFLRYVDERHELCH